MMAKKIRGYPRYEIQEDGTILASPSTKRPNGCLLRPWLVGRGYPTVSLSNGKSHKHFYVHDLVLRAFVGPKPRGHEVNHLDGNKTNNAWTNLEYVTRAENYRHRINVLGQSWPQAKISRGNAQKIKSLLVKTGRHRDQHGVWRSGKLSYATIAARFGISVGQISHIATGRSWL